ncbi:hypothetical protein ACCO45_007880 [Purpureocillium lilacinum]|uniref:Uncharacterized protein n=1 Tax=Purpureocillium lilacinum TaxID=33203 RepID=A0ACC4DN79_PURLI
MPTPEYIGSDSGTPSRSQWNFDDPVVEEYMSCRDVTPATKKSKYAKALAKHPWPDAHKFLETVYHGRQESSSQSRSIARLVTRDFREALGKLNAQLVNSSPPRIRESPDTSSTPAGKAIAPLQHEPPSSLVRERSSNPAKDPSPHDSIVVAADTDSGLGLGASDPSTSTDRATSSPGSQSEPSESNSDTNESQNAEPLARRIRLDQPASSHKRSSESESWPSPKKAKVTSDIIELDDDMPESRHHYRPLFEVNVASLDAIREETSWINDEAMHAILQVFMNCNPRGVAVTDSLWLDPSNPGDAHAYRRRMEKEWKGQETILMPICVDKHWLLAVIRESRDLIQIYDSRPGIPAELRERKRKAIKLLGGLLPNGLQAAGALQRAVVTCPILQLNDYDCGTIVLVIAFYIVLGLSPPQSEANTLSWRRVFAEFLQPLSDEEEQLIASDNRRLAATSGELHVEFQPPPWPKDAVTGTKVSAHAVLEYSKHLISCVRRSVDRIPDLLKDWGMIAG